ncbi:MAG: hypothetical protein ACLRWL_06480 [Evtepia gabavorous]
MAPSHPAGVEECSTSSKTAVKVDPLITHHFPLREMEQAFAITQAKQSIKIILNP